MPALSVSIAVSADDWIDVSDGSFANNSAFFNAGDATTVQRHAGGRFINLTIPAGSTITSANLVLTARTTASTTTVNTNLSFEAADNPAAIISDADWDSRARTATVAWDNIAAWTAGVEYTSPSLVSILQAVINRPGWASGNAVNIFWENNASSAGAQRQAQSIDGAPTTPPRLDLNYTPPAEGGLPISFLRRRR